MTEDEINKLVTLMAGLSPPANPMNYLAGLAAPPPGSLNRLAGLMAGAPLGTTLLNRLAAMPAHQHARHFDYFFSRLNPSPTYEAQASSQYTTIKGLIENRQGQASVLAPTCFLQGSYRRETAIYTINDVDIVVLCQLWFPPSQGPLGGRAGPLWNRHQIFETIAAPLRADGRYRDKVRYSPTSMCIKIDLGIKVEILPVVYQQGNNEPANEPFYLFRPETQQWEQGFARYHQSALTTKNKNTGGNFIPAIKVFKHLRSRAGLDIASFHIECFLHVLPDDLFAGSPAEYIPRLLQRIASTDGNAWWQQNYLTPCGDRIFFNNTEWDMNSWLSFYQRVIGWSGTAQLALAQSDPIQSRILWRVLLDDMFPINVT